ncbi:O-antigen translocase [Shewanella mangrovisoli]|uniref:O-antigen translocase n=1 Tax=Shewanella mangrovisoli TaxID=2864211 RepID=UPI0035B93344
MNLIKTSILSSISTALSMLSGFIITKVIAVYVGPSGLAIVGQLQNFINLMMLVTGNLFKTGLVKYTAEYHETSNSRLHDLWSSAIFLTIILNVIVFICLFFFSEKLTSFVLNDMTYEYVIITFSFSLPFFVINSIFLSILNGMGSVKKFVLINIFSSFVSLIFVSFMSLKYALSGALIAYATSQSFVLFFTLIIIFKEHWFSVRSFFCYPKFSEISNLLRFSVITLSSILASNLTMMFIRDCIINNYSDVDAGYWQGIFTLSQVVLSLVTMSFSTYLLPKLSSLQDKILIAKEIDNAIKVIFPVALFLSSLMYLTRDIIILVLYSDDFYPMRDLFFWQMLGNVIKILGWIYGYVLVSKGMVKYTVMTEIVFSLSWSMLTVIFLDKFGLIGTTYAYAINCLLHFFTMYMIFRFKVK